MSAHDSNAEIETDSMQQPGRRQVLGAIIRGDRDRQSYNVGPASERVDFRRAVERYEQIRRGTAYGTGLCPLRVAMLYLCRGDGTLTCLGPETAQYNNDKVQQ